MEQPTQIFAAARGKVGAFVDGMLSLGFGSIIVAFHNVCRGCRSC